jgi:DNA-binding MarR family transcriptional regulator
VTVAARRVRPALPGGPDGPGRTAKTGGPDGPGRTAKTGGPDGPGRTAKTGGPDGPGRTARGSGAAAPVDVADHGGVAGSELAEIGVVGTGATGAHVSAGRMFVAIARLGRRVRRDVPVSLSQSMIAALATVQVEGPIRLGDLAVAEGVRAPTMTRIVDALVAEGLAERVPDACDGRACLVRITDAGDSVLRGTRATRAAALAARIDRLPAPLRAALEAALPALEALSADEPDAAGSV